MAGQLIHLDARKPLARALMIIAIVLALGWSWFAIRWYLGNTLAEYFNAEENGPGIIQLALSLAPNDPLTHWRLADFTRGTLPLDRIGEVTKEYEKAVRLSPNDYRFWMFLGTALEQSGGIDRGEKALRRAVELAPNYSYPRWFLGNLLLRNGRYPEAFAELRQAAEGDPELRSQLFNLAWEVYDKDLDQLKTAIGDTTGARAQFSEYLLGRGRFEDGIRLWNSLNPMERKASRLNGEAMISSLVAAKHYHQAVGIWNDFAPTPADEARLGQFVDGGFETDVARASGTTFGWQVKGAPQLQIGIDPNHAHNGSRSLRIIFQVRAHLDAISVAQLVPVQPNTQYDVECFVKTEKLQSGGMPYVEIADAMDGASVATSQPAASGNNNWERVAFGFKTRANTEAIIVRINRALCGEDPVCPIFGTIWYDDFTLKSRS